MADIYRAIEAEPWIADFGHGRLNASNYLYFPLYGALAHLLDTLGILRGVAFKQFAYLNAFFASLAIVCVYAFVHRLTGSVLTAVLATLFHFGSGFFLLLGVISEDIMPGYFLLLLYAALHDNYEATPVLSDPFAGNYYELKHKSMH